MIACSFPIWITELDIFWKIYLCRYAIILAQMRLFSRLLRFQVNIVQAEDFFTEIFVHLLQQNEELFWKWLPSLGFSESHRYQAFQISTQESFLEGRPDMLIELFTKKRSAWILIESKLGSAEGHNQLHNYARILQKQKNLKERYLYYITRDYDPKSKGEILKDIPSHQVIFKQLRWYEVYNFLCSHRETNQLVDEVCAFMEELGMAQNNIFTPTNLLALNQISQVLSMMNETLFSEVTQQMKEVFGDCSSQARARTELQYDRYIVFTYPQPYYWLALGYWFGETAYPMCGAVICTAGGQNPPEEFFDGLRKIEEMEGWQGYNLNKMRQQPRIYKRKPLNALLTTDDHIETVKQFFLELLQDMHAINRQYLSHDSY